MMHMPTMNQSPESLEPVASCIMPMTYGPRKPPQRPMVLTKAMPPARAAPVSRVAG